LLLASLGIYGVISYSVTQQTQEIGIRMALGATQGRVQLGVIARTLKLALAGIAVGIVASFAIAALIASLLFATKPTDPVTFAGMILLLVAVALIAGYLPARRASIQSSLFAATDKGSRSLTKDEDTPPLPGQDSTSHPQK
jgi:ABC-type antimicrobial peptide transport system permease subunit